MDKIKQKGRAVALRNRWRRQALKGEMEMKSPENILMIGPTGVGKTEISKIIKISRGTICKSWGNKILKLVTRRDVEQIIRDLIEIAISMEKVKKEKKFTQKHKN